MARRALIIGCPTGGLCGVENDTTIMREVLGAYGFDVRSCLGDDAGRDGILEAYEALIRDTQEGDATVIYYSGHGGLATDMQSAAGIGEPRPIRHRFLVPVDIDHSTVDDFRGILDFELSALQSRLCRRSRNTTTWLDCCYAARMWRERGLKLRALQKPRRVDIAAGLRRWRLRVPSARLDTESHPDAVRLVASGPNRPAYEHINDDGLSIGIFTEQLYRLLVEVYDTRVSWQSMIHRLRRRVLARSPRQRCEIEGPARRYLFCLQETARDGALPLERTDAELVLQGGRAHGVSVGDVYEISGPPARGDLERRVTATVLTVDLALSTVRLDPPVDPRQLPLGAVAMPLRKAEPRGVVDLVASGRERSRLAALIDASPSLRQLRDRDALAPLASIIVERGVLSLNGPGGEPLVYSETYDDRVAVAAVAGLEALARAAELLCLSSSAGTDELAADVVSELGRIVDGRCEPLPDSGSAWTPGDRLVLRIAHGGREPIYVSVLSLGIDGAIDLLSSAEPAGIELLPGDEYWLGYDARLGLQGLPITWPTTVPPVAPRTEWIVVTMADRPVDLRPLESTGLRGLRESVKPSVQRDRKPMRPRRSRFAVRHLDFVVEPPDGHPT